MADDIVKASEEFSNNFKDSDKSIERIKNNLKEATSYMSQFTGSGPGTPNSMGGQVNATSGFGRGSFQTMNGQNVNVGSDGFARGVNATEGDYKRDINNMQPMFDSVKNLGKGVISSALMAMPDPNEAIYSELTSSRLKFYSGINNAQAEARKLRFSQMGTPTDALDAAYASNLGADIGLLPGLSNYYPNAKRSAGSYYGGVMGGAALASNLTPGLGLQGGMAVMGSMNQARRVNMLRMIGVNVRGIGGTNMNDLPSIIARIYELLKNANGGKNPSQNDIAVSAMSGNALDSILNQYFGDDENLRQVVIAGLMQMVNKSGGSLNKFGTPEELSKTGGTTATASSLGVRSSRELDLIQQFDAYTTKGIRFANDALYNTYGALMAGGKNFGFARGAATTMAFAETFGGARNGAGAILAKSIIDAMGTGVDMLTSKLGPAGKMLSDLGLAGASLAALEGVDRWDVGNTYNFMVPKQTGKPKAGVTLNVFSNSTDPSQIGTAINTATLAELSRRS
jgi:hypothetical protein